MAFVRSFKCLLYSLYCIDLEPIIPGKDFRIFYWIKFVSCLMISKARPQGCAINDKWSNEGWAKSDLNIGMCYLFSLAIKIKQTKHMFWSFSEVSEDIKKHSMPLWKAYNLFSLVDSFQKIEINSLQSLKVKYVSRLNFDTPFTTCHIAINCTLRLAPLLAFFEEQLLIEEGLGTQYIY